MFLNFFQNGTFAQYYAVIFADLMSLAYGFAVGWSSAIFPRLRSEETPLPSGPLTLDEASWVSSIMYIAGMAAVLLYGMAGAKFGKKYTILFMAIPTLCSWILILLAENVYFLYASRCLAGAGGVGVMVLIPQFVTEIAETRIRGALGSIMMVMNNLGIILAFITTAFMDFYVVPWFPIVICIVFVVGFSIVPESPKFLKMKNQTKKAEEAFIFYRGLQKSLASVSTKTQISAFHSENAGGSVSENITRKEICNVPTCKAIFIGMTLMSIASFSGPFVLTNYYGVLFRTSGSSLSPETSTIIVGIVQIFGACLALILVEKAGRRPLLLISGYGSAFCLFLVGIYTYLKDNEHDLSSLTWAPLVLFSGLVFLASCGATTLPHVVNAEILSQRIRGSLLACYIIYTWGLVFGLVKIFPFLLAYLGMHGALWIFTAVLCLLISIIAVILPETKGKTIDAIREMLADKKFTRSENFSK